MTDALDYDGLSWIEIGKAARLSRTKAAVIRDAIGEGKIRSLEVDGRAYIPVTVANRLRREMVLMLSVKRMNRRRNLPPARNPGLLTKEKQDILPMSSGRVGRGWKGQKPES